MVPRNLTVSFFVLALAAIAAGNTVFDFKEDMEGCTSFRGMWRWTDRAGLNNTLPSDSIDDGFAVLTQVAEADELNTPHFSIPEGGTLTVSFFLRSASQSGNNLYIDLSETGKPIEAFLDLTSYSGPSSDGWFTVTKEIPPAENEVMLIIFCYNAGEAPAGSLMYGCALDQLKIEVQGEETTTAATMVPVTTALATETTESTAAPTEAPTTTAAPTEAPTTTAAPTEAPTTTAAPTPAPETTTEGPPGPLVYDFQSGTDGWTLSQMNGAAWKRVFFDNTGLPVSAPPEGPWVLQALSVDKFAGTTLAQSPKLQATGGNLKVDIAFWMDGDRDLPAQLKARRRGGFDSYDVNPVVNLDPYGDQTNYHWVTYSGYLYNMLPGETFTLTLEGCLGSHPNNSVVINKVVIDGAEEIPTDETNLIDFEDGLFGWSMGNMDGGRWLLKRWSEVDPSLNVPQPSDGENFLLVERFDIHSGVISLESPAFPIQAGQRKKLHVKFWLRGSVVYPAALRFRKKTMNGEYDDLPFLNLAPYGDINHPDWMLLDREYYIPVEETEKAFQVVIEADLGNDANNMVALDDLNIITEYF